MIVDLLVKAGPFSAGGRPGLQVTDVPNSTSREPALARGSCRERLAGRNNHYAAALTCPFRARARLGAMLDGALEGARPVGLRPRRSEDPTLLSREFPISIGSRCEGLERAPVGETAASSTELERGRARPTAGAVAVGSRSLSLTRANTHTHPRERARAGRGPWQSTGRETQTRKLERIERLGPRDSDKRPTDSDKGPRDLDKGPTDWDENTRRANSPERTRRFPLKEMTGGASGSAVSRRRKVA